jgi:hypothetical protein
MNITTTHASFTTLLRPDCSDSQAVRYVSIVLRHNTENIGVIVQWANGDEWTYLVPLATVIANLGEDSVGRFANAMKREAVFTMNATREVNAIREAVGV